VIQIQYIVVFYYYLEPGFNQEWTEDLEWVQDFILTVITSPIYLVNLNHEFSNEHLSLLKDEHEHDHDDKNHGHSHSNGQHGHIHGRSKSNSRKKINLIHMTVIKILQIFGLIHNPRIAYRIRQTTKKNTRKTGTAC